MNLATDFDGDFPLPTHFISTPTPTKRSAVDCALKLLAQLDLDVATLTPFMIHSLYWVELRSEFALLDTRITSSSFPKWPHCAFVSNKAMRHIPPNTLFAQPSIYALAENLFHEAIHQKINVSVLNDEIMADHFDSRRSPKIFIAWRSDQESRNQWWELDRAFHAVCVYSGVIKLREKALRSDLGRAEKKYIQEAIVSGRSSFNYLLTQLQQNEHRAFFKSKGQKILDSLSSRPYV